MARKVSPEAKAREETMDALYRAQEVYYGVMDVKTAKQRIAIAQQALAISRLCADAHVLLAEHAKPGSDEALAHWRHGVEVGREALGPDFDEFAGEFWGFIETRPYMRARFGLAWALWLRGERDEAVDHLNAMLELNPNDNQGVRYVLASWLVEAGQGDALQALLERYEDDDSAVWLWTGALAAFRREGDGKDSRKLLKKALKQNEYVPAYLLGERPMPKRLPAFMGFGDEDEAVHYVSDAREAWKLTPGALDWLRDQHNSSASASAKPKKRASMPKAKKPKQPEGEASSS